jgi:ATP-binding cassette subfamily B multidrug efflux pump
MTAPARASKTSSAPPPPLMGRPGGGPMGFFREQEKAKDTRHVLARLWGYIQRQRWILLGTLLLVALTSFVSLLGPYLMGRAIDAYIMKNDLTGLLGLLALMLLTYLLGSAGTWLQAYLMAGVAQYAVRDIRTDLFDRLQSLPVRYFDQHTHGDLMSRLTNDVENIANVLAVGFSQFVSSVLNLVGIVIFMFILNPSLAAISLTVMPVTYLITREIARRTRAGFRETHRYRRAHRQSLRP